ALPQAAVSPARTALRPTATSLSRLPRRMGSGGAMVPQEVAARVDLRHPLRYHPRFASGGYLHGRVDGQATPGRIVDGGADPRRSGRLRKPHPAHRADTRAHGDADARAGSDADSRPHAHAMPTGPMRGARREHGPRAAE